MKKARAAVLTTLAGVATLLPGTQARALPEEFVMERVARIPCGTRACVTALQFAQNGDLFVNVRNGQVRIIRDGKLVSSPYATVQTTTAVEGGLLGLALDPDFVTNRYIYVFRTTPGGGRDMVERLGPGKARKTLMDLPAGGAYHHGGALAFGPDDKLYVTNGEAHDAGRAQQARAFGGKVYRINPDGSIPDDNPFDGSPTWSFGHRNSLGIAFDPVGGRLWETENGPSGRDDEINLIRKGGNYGWPNVTGKSTSGGRFIGAAVHYGGAIVPTNLTFGGDAFPQAYRGNLFVGAYQQGSIHRLILNGARNAVVRDEIFLSGQAVVGMTFGPDGLYFGTDDSVYRVRARTAQAQSPSPTPTPTPSESESPQPQFSRLPAEPEPSRIWIPLAVVLGLGAAGGIYALARKRRST